MRKMEKIRLFSLVCSLLLSMTTLLGCSSEQVNSTPEITPQVQNPPVTAAGNVKMDNYKPRLDGVAIVEMTVNGSPVTIEIDGNNAPVTAGNFVDLVQRGFYNGLTFHRVEKDPQPFVVQGGDPKGNGTGGFMDPATKQERFIPLEIKLKEEKEPIYGQAIGAQVTARVPVVALPHKRGAIAMARAQAPNSASSQFYFALDDINVLDGDYAVFGYVTKGMDVIDKVKVGDRIQSAKVVSGLENWKK
jgi:peptidyl-prolyl cis-trans isomerase B (cyclophilin B)